MTQTIAIVNPSEAETKSIGALLNRIGYSYRAYESAEQFINVLANKSKEAPGILMVDAELSGLNGFELLQLIRMGEHNISSIVMAPEGDIDAAMKAIQAGADDYVVKPINNQRLRVALDHVSEKRSMRVELSALRQSLQKKIKFSDIVGDSPAMKTLYRLMHKAAESEVSVLVLGESGVGKEMVARAIHSTSPRSKSPFVAVNCGAIPEQLVESVLFGHKKGAFTGADSDAIGKFEAATGGTLFLDEVGELSLNMQVKLLRALQEREVDPVGSSMPVPVNVRIVAATNRDLKEMVQQGRFREDLFYRLNIFPVHIPALREREGDVVLLAKHFLDVYNATHNKKKSLTPPAEKFISSLPWPGNVRQLENAITRTALLTDANKLEKNDFYWLSTDMESLTPASHADASSSDSEGIAPLSEVERAHIQKAVFALQGNLAEVARRLEVSRSTLYRKLEQYGLDHVFTSKDAS
ncbi:MAG: sigma-54 dependent transcriptional regulator [Pseudomonadota bacterium]|nr:sigma-54 dependent transcriptional regulator [Pseudomonadota bacterium]